MTTKLRSTVIASMEEFVDTPVVYLPSDTPEQETELVLAAHDHLNDARTDDLEIDRMQSLAQGLEDLAEAASTITEATPRELVLIDIANQLSLAGSGMASEETLPGLESYLGTTVSTESIKETALKIWNAAMAFIKRVWEHIQNFFTKLFSTLNGMKKKATELKAAAKRTGNAKPGEVKFTLGGEANALAVNHVVPLNAQQLHGVLENVNHQSKVIFGDYVKQVEQTGAAFSKLLRDMNSSNQMSYDWFDRITSAASTLQFGRVKQSLGCHDVTDARFAPGTVQLAVPLPGNHSIAFHKPTNEHFQQHNAAGGGYEAFAETFEKIYFDMVKTSDAHHDHTLTKQEFAVMSAADMEKACDSVIDLCDTMLAYHNGSSQKNIRSAVWTIGGLSKVLGMKVGSAPNLPAGMQAQFRLSLHILRTYSKWSTQPHAELAKVAHATCRSTLALVARNLAVYEGRAGDPRQAQPAGPALAAPVAATA